MLAGAAFAACTGRSLAPAGEDAGAVTVGPGPTADGGGTSVPPPATSDPCADAGAPNEAPPDLACTGLYESGGAELAEGVRAYTPGVTFYSDGAEKHRWVRLPAGATIDSTDMGAWVFPVGTRAWKEFVVGGKKVETRLLWKRGEGDWAVATYVWNAEQTRAERVDGGRANVLGTGYDVPAATLCATCHDGSRDGLLGFEALSLGLPTASGLTLATLVAEGRLSKAPAKTELTLPEDATGKAGAALGWLHANCGMACHNPNDTAGARFSGLFLKLRPEDGVDLADAGSDAGGDAGSGADAGSDGGDGGLARLSSARVRATLAWTTAAGIKPTMPDYASKGFQRIAPGDAAHSLVPTLAGLPRTQPNAMPLVGPSTVDDAGVDGVRRWIDALGKDGGL